VLFHKISIIIKETPLVLTPHPLSQSGMQFLFSFNLKLLFKGFGLCLLLSKIFSLCQCWHMHVIHVMTVQYNEIVRASAFCNDKYR